MRDGERKKLVILYFFRSQAVVSIQRLFFLCHLLRHLKSSTTGLFVQQLVQAYIKANIKAPHHWSFCEGNPLADGLTQG